MRPALAVVAAALILAGCGRPGGAPQPPANRSPWFERIADEDNLGGVRLTLPGKRPLSLLQTIGNGAALADFNADGNLDILIVSDPPALFRGDGKRGFRKVGDLPVQGVAVGDMDNDGDPDVYLSGYRTAALWRNDNGSFVDATAASGLRDEPWGTAATFADLDHDRLPDLIVANYVRFEPENGTRVLCDFRDSTGKTVLAACGPREYLPLSAKVYRNTGNGTFRDVTTAWNATSRGRGLGVAVADPEISGALRVAIANDEAPGDLWRIDQDGGGRISNIGDRSGTAYDRDGNLHGGMGVDWGDADGDGRLDLAVATFAGEPMSVYVNDGQDLYRDTGPDNGTGMATKPYVTFGLRWMDVDNDGHLDLAVANGHVQDNSSQLREGSPFRQPAQILMNRGDGTFADRSAEAGPGITEPMVGRGLASGDIDNDGKIDLLLIDSDGAPRMLRNIHPSSGNWIGFSLEGTRSPRDGTGAIVTVVAGGKRFVRHSHTDGSYLSASDQRVLVGLGKLPSIEKIEVRWPSGAKQVLQGLATGRYHRLKEPAGK
jgi:hypothetical protein